MGGTESKKQKILLIDDNKEVLLLLENLLESENYEVVKMTSAKQALNFIDNSIDLIILDLLMPELDGTEFLKIFRSNDNFQDIPVIICTAKEKTPEDIADLFKIGINDYINTPFFKQELIARVRVQLGNKLLKNKLNELNKILKKDVEEYKRLFTISLEYGAKLEKDLTDKIENINTSKDIPDLNVSEEEIGIKLKKYGEERDTYKRENEKFKKKIEDLNLMFSTIVMHDTIIEDQLSDKLDEVTITSITDPLTGIYNRVKMNESLSIEISKANETNSDLSLIMIDIDHFKNINDEYGHDIGDSILISVTDLIKKNIDDNLIFARWGGEEF